MKLFFPAIVIFFLIGCTHSLNATKKNAVEVLSKSDQQLQQLIHTHQQFYQQSSPFNDPQVGGNNSKLPDLSAQFLAKQNKKREMSEGKVKELFLISFSKTNISITK